MDNILDYIGIIAGKVVVEKSFLLGDINVEEKKHPSIFISYSWDSDDHKEKVKNFVQALRLDNINVTYDGDLQFGERFPHYMEKSILVYRIINNCNKYPNCGTMYLSQRGGTHNATQSK